MLVGVSCKEQDASQSSSRDRAATHHKTESSSSLQKNSPSNDLASLRRLCTVPAFISSAKWATYDIGQDWGLVAVLDIDRDQIAAADAALEQSDTNQVFLGTSPVLDWVANAGAELHQTEVNGRYLTSLQVYKPDPFTSSPLLYGFVLRPKPDRLVLGLHTR
jgi:hypothetical protein